MFKVGFDNEAYLKTQSEKIRERISKFGGKLYLEFGGKLFDDHHASRVLPGFAPDSKIRMLEKIKDKAEVIIAINAGDIEKNKVRGDLGITYDQDVLRLIDAFRGYVPGSPQLAASIGLAYNYDYWFIDADFEYFAESYLSMNPLYRTDYASAGPDKTVTPAEVEYMAAQERFPAFSLVNLSIGKSWYIQRKYQIGFSLNVKNLLNRKDIRTGGYEQNRLVDNTTSGERYYRFDSKYYYMSGFNYMLNIYFRF